MRCIICGINSSWSTDLSVHLRGRETRSKDILNLFREKTKCEAKWKVFLAINKIDCYWLMFWTRIGYITHYSCLTANGKSFAERIVLKSYLLQVQGGIISKGNVRENLPKGYKESHLHLMRISHTHTHTHTQRYSRRNEWALVHIFPQQTEIFNKRNWLFFWATEMRLVCF